MPAVTLSALKELEKGLDLNPKLLAHLLGVSERAVYRGVSGAGAIIALAITEALKEHRLSIRALAITSARAEGLEGLLRRLMKSYGATDRS